MINPSTLRIGNWVEYPLFGKSRIESGSEIDAIAENAGNPIPLEESVMLKAGFVKEINENIHFYIDIPEGNRLTFTEDWSYSIKDARDLNLAVYPCFEPIESLHQLQNLYFILANKELTVEL